MPCHWIPIYIGMVNRVREIERDSNRDKGGEVKEDG